MSKNLKNFFSERRNDNDGLMGRIKSVQRGRFDAFMDGEEDEDDVPKEKKEPEVVPLPEKEETAEDTGSSSDNSATDIVATIAAVDAINS